MRVLKLTLGKTFFLQFFLQFLFLVWTVRTASPAVGRMWLRRPDSKITRPDARGLLYAYVAMRVRTG
jgi:hypothetical protein